MLTISLFTEVIISLSFLVCLCLTPFVVSKKILTCLYDTVKTWIAWSSGGWLLTIFNTKELMFSEYQKSCSFHLPSLYAPDVFLPSSQAKLLDVRTQHVLSVDQAHFDLLQSEYTFLSQKIRQPKVHQDAVKLALKPGITLDRWIPALTEEISLAFQDTIEKYRGSSAELDGIETTRLYPVLHEVIVRASNRVISGTKLCRNEEFLTNAKRFTSVVPFGAVLIKSCPTLLKPFIGRIATIPNWIFLHRCARHSVPLIERRLEIAAQKQSVEKPDVDLDEGMLQTLADQAVKSGEALEVSAKTLSIRLLVLNFASIYPSFATVWNTVLALAASSPDKGFIAGIREEIERVKGDGTDAWTGEELDQLWRLDSAIKESMRTWMPLASGMIRTVSSPSGYTLPDGIHLNQGAMVGLPMHSIHHDPNFYPHPEKYDAFRFSKMREKSNGGKEHALTSISRPEFMAFGLGIHACPGRHLASIMIKLILIHLLKHYEIERLVCRPRNRYIGAVILPPKEVDLAISRRV